MFAGFQAHVMNIVVLNQTPAQLDRRLCSIDFRTENPCIARVSVDVLNSVRQSRLARRRSNNRPFDKCFAFKSLWCWITSQSVIILSLSIITDIISGYCQPLNGSPSNQLLLSTGMEIIFITLTYINFWNKINSLYYLWEFNHSLSAITLQIKLIQETNWTSVERHSFIMKPR